MRNWQTGFLANRLEYPVLSSLSKENGQQRFGGVQVATLIFKPGAIWIPCCQVRHNPHLTLKIAGYDLSGVDAVLHHHPNHAGPRETFHFSDAVKFVQNVSRDAERNHFNSFTLRRHS